MKTKRIILWILMLLPLAATAIALFYLPDQVPAHYGFSGKVDRWGSKYETLVFPILSVLTGLFLLAMARVARRQDAEGKNETAVLWTGIGCEVLFCAMTAYFLIMDFQQVRDLHSVPVALTQIMFGVWGVFMIGIGVVMPKLGRNAVIGLRTENTMKNDENWTKSQRFGGASFVLGGVLTLLACLLTRGAVCFWVCTAILLAVVIADAVYAHRL